MPTVCLDFDGVLHRYADGWTGAKPEDGVVEGAQEFVSWLHIAGYRVAVSSSRARDPEGLASISEWLSRHGMMGFISEITPSKPPAVLYVDDRGFRFQGDFAPIKALLTEARNRDPGTWAHQKSHDNVPERMRRAAISAPNNLWSDAHNWFLNYESVGSAIGRMLDEKQQNYGDSFHKCPAVLKVLYPDGIPVDQYENVLWMARILDKLFRLAKGMPDAEDPIRDIAGYALLRCVDKKENG